MAEDFQIWWTQKEGESVLTKTYLVQYSKDRETAFHNRFSPCYFCLELLSALGSKFYTTGSSLTHNGNKTLNWHASCQSLIQDKLFAISSPVIFEAINNVILQQIWGKHEKISLLKKTAVISRWSSIMNHIAITFSFRRQNLWSPYQIRKWKSIYFATRIIKWQAQLSSV